MNQKWITALKRYGFLVVPALFYIATVGHYIGFGDTALLVNDIQRGGIESHVNNHPLTVVTGMVFKVLLPFHELALRANLVSVFYGSLTIAVFYLLLIAEFGSVIMAAWCATLLMVCHSMWWHSTIVENYAATSFLTVLCLYCWRQLDTTKEKKWLWTLCSIAGLGIFNHVQMSFICVGVVVTGVMIGRRDKALFGVVSRCAGFAALGMLPWLTLIVRDTARVGSFQTIIKGAFVGSFKDTFFGGSLSASFFETLYVMWFQSPTLYLAGLGAFGIYLAYRRTPRSPSFWGVISAFSINTINFCFYPTWDKFAFLLMSFVFLHYFASLAVNHCFRLLNNRPLAKNAGYAYLTLSLLMPPYLYGNLAKWGSNPSSVWASRYNNNYSENSYYQSEFIINPNKRGYDDVDRFAKLLFAKLPPNATFLDDDSRTYYPLADYYQKHYGIRPDVSTLLVNSWGFANWGLGSDTLADIITKAYYLDKPFYAISNKAPISGFMAEAQKRVPEIELVKFFIGESRWVYRLVTQSEVTTARKLAVQDLPWINTLNVTAPKGYFDLAPKDIVFFSTGTSQTQNMKSFTGKWHSDDQLFFNGEKPGSNLEFYLKSKDSRTVALSFWMTSGPDFAKVRIEIFPGQAEATVDLYETTVQPTKIKISEVSLAPGINQVKITILEKNPRSSAYHFGVDGIEYSTTAMK